MNLIERYLHELGRYLPARNREDILAELRSHLTETLDERTNGNPTEADAAALLKETGAPRKVAASYPGGQQYLIGPEIYPFFEMVAGIVLGAVILAQLIAFGVQVWIGDQGFSAWDALGGVFSGCLSALGAVVIVFIILQRVGVNPQKDEEWDPHSLPQIVEEEKIKRGERIFGIVGGSILLALLATFSGRIGFYQYPGGTFYADPVIDQYLVLILLSVLASISMDAFLLWQGRWTLASRIAKVGINVFSIVVLALLYQGHTAWLQAHGSNVFLMQIEKMGSDLAGSVQMIGMESFRLAFGVALVVTTIETILLVVRLVRRFIRKDAIEFSAK